LNNTIWLSEQIDADELQSLIEKMEACRVESNEPINLYITSEGGNSEITMAMCNLIKRDGNIHGYVIANIASAGTLIFASCARRYVYPMTRLGFHIGYWDDVKMRLDAKVLKVLLEQFEASDRRSCEIYAAASNKPAKWWRSLLNRNSYGVWLDAAELVAIGMAEWSEGTLSRDESSGKENGNACLC
jgi:ATP-dependent protease ClpP protease subunit